MNKVMNAQIKRDPLLQRRRREAVALAPKIKNHRRGIAGGFGGLS
jgi:hypothetical protein